MLGVFLVKSSQNSVSGLVITIPMTSVAVAQGWKIKLNCNIQYSSIYLRVESQTKNSKLSQLQVNQHIQYIYSIYRTWTHGISTRRLQLTVLLHHHSGCNFNIHNTITITDKKPKNPHKPDQPQITTRPSQWLTYAFANQRRLQFGETLYSRKLIGTRHI